MALAVTRRRKIGGARKQDNEPKMYRLLNGTHAGEIIRNEDGSFEPGEIYRKGDIVESKFNLIDLFGADRFLLLSGDAAAEARAARDEQDESLAEDGSGPPENVRPKARGTILDENPGDHVKDVPATMAQNVASKLGDNVTDDFPKAKDADLIVYKKGGKFFVADRDSPDDPIEHGKGLTKAETNKLLSKQVR